MSFLSDRGRRRALLAATAIVWAPSAFAANTTIANGTTRTTRLTMQGTDTLTVDSGGAITTSRDPSVRLTGSNANLTIDNSGTISSTDGRAIRAEDFSGSFSLSLTNETGALIQGTDDALAISSSINGGTVTVVNDGTIRSTGGQAIGFRPATGGTISITNNGLMETKGTQDVVRTGGNATITNTGTIQNTTDGVWTGSYWNRANAVDFYTAGSGTVYNSGTISGSKSGIAGQSGTGSFEITNYADGDIIGRNGPAIRFSIPDGVDTPEELATLKAVHVVNYGTITGEATDLSHPSRWNTDGDGIDIDYLANIENHGTIESTGALGVWADDPAHINVPEAIAIGGGSITNYWGGLIHSKGQAIVVDDSDGGSAYGATTITNAGAIVSDIGEAITLRGDFADTLKNYGFIVGDVDMGGGSDTVKNWGWISGSVDLGSGNDTLENGGAILGDVAAGAGDDKVRNDGWIAGKVTLGGGRNSLDNDGVILRGVTAGDGNDKVDNSGWIGGDVTLGNGRNRVDNGGAILGDVATGSGDDKVDNSGWIGGDVTLGKGRNSLDNSGVIRGDVAAGSGDDKVDNSGWIGGDVALGNGRNVLDNSGAILGDVAGGNGDDTVHNEGWIGGDIWLGRGTDLVSNSGAIVGNIAFGSGFGLLANSGSIGGSVSADWGMGWFANSGTIGGDVVGGNFLFNTGAIGGDVRVEHGASVTLNAGNIGGKVSFAGGDDVLANSGSIAGDVSFSYGKDWLINSGAIGGNVAMGSGDDTVELHDGSSIAGTLDGGDGSDSLSVWSSSSDVATLSRVSAFETLGIRQGNWTFGDDQSYSDGVTVYSGASLAVNTTLSAVTTVQGGARLSGSGSVSGLVTTGLGAVIVPGTGTSGTLSVNGDASLNDATFMVGMAADGASNRLAVSGTAAVNGGTVVLDLAPGPYVVGTKATIVSADGGVTGSGFSSLQAPSTLFITPQLGMEPNAVTITLDRNGVPFASFAQTANQWAVANALDAGTSASGLYNLIANSTTGAFLPQTYDSLSGEIHADLVGTLLDQSMQTELTLLQRLRQIGVPGKTAAPSQKLGYGEEAKPNTAAFDALEASGPHYSGWTQAFGSWLNRDGDGNSANTDSSVGGALVGADLSNDNYTFGLAGGYSWGSADTSNWSSSADIDTALLAVYGGVALDAVKLRGGASMGWSSIDTTRTATAGGVTERPQANYDATTGNVFGEVAYDAKVGGSIIEPYAGLGWVSVNGDSFSETAAVLTGLSSSGASYSTAYSTLGARFSTDFLVDGNRLTPRAMLGWRHAFDDVPPEAAMLFNNTATGFTVIGTPIAQDSLLVEAGADLAFNQRVSLGVVYSGSFASNADSNAVKVTGEVRF
ncbi:autotransporter domain-containing protein [Kaistia dalseonensis]|uniref:Outer membrane autotransporter protein n=1 Tax=Kaistia dalseonensis TaxID=410840 RepID=A0ABU0HDG0_9HYPH|nr:autotransporter domain-containing protein [Kaistia dalseonensis]MCX5497138.1 autotransporter domain-containing protein [Kaistia dalseonensis]MDQ0439765.1 outer membrane autotransporter protein [Kaistia dalseonensis]